MSYDFTDVYHVNVNINDIEIFFCKGSNGVSKIFDLTIVTANTAEQ